MKARKNLEVCWVLEDLLLAIQKIIEADITTLISRMKEIIQIQENSFTCFTLLEVFLNSFPSKNCLHLQVFPCCLHARVMDLEIQS